MTPEDREFLHQTSVPVGSVNRALVLHVALLAGFWGGHKFLLGARREGWIYLALSWTSIPLWAGLGDFVDLLRRPAIGSGFLKRRLLKRHPAEANVVERATWWQLGRVVFLFALFVAFSVWMAMRMGSGEKRVSALCAQMTGMPAAALAEFARSNVLHHGALHEGFNVLTDPATRGRHGCNVRVESGVVAEATYYFLD